VSLSWNHDVVPAVVIQFLATTQAAVPSRLGGGTALSGLHLGHRLSRDLDLFFDEKEKVRELLPQIAPISRSLGGTFRVIRDGGAFVRGILELPGHALEVDLVHEPSTPLAPQNVVERVTVESLADLRANKLTCLLSRSEPRDLVDVLFLERAGYAPENDLEMALEKDAGIDAGILGHLLSTFRVSPLPQMLAPLTEAELQTYRDELAERLRLISVAPGQ
jgi:hypothetical protein